jgi:uncharacterized protein YhjY with autotransporter beta-barrel domain
MMEQFQKRSSKNIRTPVYIRENTNWNIFAVASGVFSKINNVRDLPSTSSTTGYFGGGVDYRIHPYANFGIYAGYQGIWGKYFNGSILRANGVKYGLYGTVQCPGFLSRNSLPPARLASGLSKFGVQTPRVQLEDNFYLNAIVGGGANCLNQTRYINVDLMFSKSDRTARSHPFAGEFDSLLGAGYEVQLSAWRLGLNTSLQYTYLGIRAFNESGAGNLNVRTSAQNPSSLVYTLGANISYLWEIAPNSVILPTIGLYWQHEFLNKAQLIGARFDNGRGTSFNIYTRAAARNNAFGAIGITAQIGRQFTAYAYYNPQFGGNGVLVSSQGITVGIAYGF